MALIVDQTLRLCLQPRASAIRCRAARSISIGAGPAWLRGGGTRGTTARRDSDGRALPLPGVRSGCVAARRTRRRSGVEWRRGFRGPSHRHVATQGREGFGEDLGKQSAPAPGTTTATAGDEDDQIKPIAFLFLIGGRGSGAVFPFSLTKGTSALDPSFAPSLLALASRMRRRRWMERNLAELDVRAQTGSGDQPEPQDWDGMDAEVLTWCPVKRTYSFLSSSAFVVVNKNV